MLVKMDIYKYSFKYFYSHTRWLYELFVFTRGKYLKSYEMFHSGCNCNSAAGGVSVSRSPKR
jgi:hypothetical protein